MPESSHTPSVFTIFADGIKRQVLGVQEYAQLTFRSLANLATSPRYWSDTLEQMDLIGVGSLPIVILTGFFIGGVVVLQTASPFEKFGETARSEEHTSELQLHINI